MKLTDIRIKWTNGAACPEGLSLQDICHIFRKDKKLFFTNGNLELPIDEKAVQNLFSIEGNISWSEVEFTEEKVKK